ncbi:MAG: precorrin-6A/cobalt-precorrin-6A reductase [Cyanobacteria bacterium MAG CAR4_bin_6]|nr:precorrin-6A/cobalt-precorrin-6A reductase [Cyanobacteria bacterium MAG CAR4_bin_6]MCY4236660.1 precorrin-6A/cobalt-precorrin-6A reductase [Cyanobacteria bacterium MAG CAR2_bin_4]MCY4332399.1 precorrin-6A/cobalt-precorrin-6A reductase [Cyanobacteria bacterium MAG CAR1_bin_15]
MVHSWKCRNWIWLVAGTEDGVWAARQLLALSVPVRVQVVSPGACRAYGLLTANPAFQCRAMALTPREVHRVLTGPAPPALVLDATHPFALRITRTLHTACGASAIPYLRLQRPQLKPGAATLVDRLEAVQDLGSRSLLTAIGSRNLAPLVAWHGPQRTAARILPTATALQQALAAGLPPERIAPLQPVGTGHGGEIHPPPDPGTCLEAALCRRWAADVVLARQSGGTPERHWRRVCAALGVSLWLLRRPQESSGMAGCTRETLSQRVQECLRKPRP